MNIIMLVSPHLKRTLPTEHTSQSVLFRLKLPSTARKHTNRSLSDSVLSVRSDSGMMGRSVRLPNSFYDDHSRLYQQRSKVLVEKSTSFQSRPISLSERRRYESQRTETVVERRKRLASLDSAAPLAQTDPQMRLEARQQAKLRFKDVMQNKYRKLQHGESFTRVSKTILQRSVTQTLTNRPNIEWKSPFLTKKHSSSARPLKQRALEHVLGNEDPSQLKVLNLDRLFRVKDGKLGNVVPLPVAKLSLVSHRSTMMKAVQTKDKLQEVIKEYNDLLRLMTLKKASGKLGIRGKNFTKSPTIEELMGIKLGPQKNTSFPRGQFLDDNVFTAHCKLFLSKIKKDVHLVRRILGGLTQEENSPGISLGAFTKFNLLFGSGAGLEEKASFLTYFFIPLGQERIDFPVLRLILELMCQQLPDIGELRVQTDLISQQEKSRIFLEALHRVLFGDIENESKGGLSRNTLKSVLLANSDASDLMIRLLQQQ